MKLLLIITFLLIGCSQEGESTLSTGSSASNNSDTLSITAPLGNAFMNASTGITDLTIAGVCENDLTVVISNNNTDIYSFPCVSNSYSQIFELANIVVGSNSIKVRQAGSESDFELTVDLVVPSMTITAPVLINSINESSYTLSGTCDEQNAIVSGDIGGTDFSASCFSSVWSATGIDGSSLSESTHTVNYQIEDLAGNIQSASTSVIKNAALPTVTSVLAPVDGAYSTGSSLDFQLTFSTNVTVTNIPCINIDIGGSAEEACYTSGSNGNALIFSYTIQGGDIDADGVSLDSTINLKTGSIADINFNNANLSISSIPSLTAVLVDTLTIGPDAVAVLNQTNLSVDRTQASFSWTAPAHNGDPITKYIVRYKKSSDSEYVYLNPDPITTNTTISSLSTEELYDVQVAAFNGVIGPYSSVLQFSTVFSPASLGALIWYEAKDINGDGGAVADGTSITTWTDKSGNGNNAAKISGTSATIETVDGYKVIRLDSSGYRTIESLGETSNTDIEIYIVAKTRQVTNSFAFVNENQGNSNRFGTHFPWGNGNAYIDLPIGNRMNGPWGGNTTDFIAWTFRGSTTQGKALERDGDEILNAGNRTLSPPLKKWTIGANYAGSSNHWKADMQAMFVFDKVLDAQQRADFFQYIEDEYGVTMP